MRRTDWLIVIYPTGQRVELALYGDGKVHDRATQVRPAGVRAAIAELKYIAGPDVDVEVIDLTVEIESVE